MVIYTNNFLRAAKHKDIMTTRRYHCRASIFLAGFYTFYIVFLLDLEKKCIVSFWIIYNKNCTLEKPMRVGYYVILLKAEQTVGDKRNIKYKIWKRWFKECTTFLQCTLNTATQYEKQTIEK